MTLREIADELVKGCREGHEKDNLDRLYAADAVAVEACDMHGQGREASGLEAIRAKHDWWEANAEVLEQKVEGPFLHGDDRFAVVFKVKVKTPETGEVSDVHEVAVYHVVDGKIVREEFFY